MWPITWATLIKVSSRCKQEGCHNWEGSNDKISCIALLRFSSRNIRQGAVPFPGTRAKWVWENRASAQCAVWHSSGQLDLSLSHPRSEGSESQRDLTRKDPHSLHVKLYLLWKVSSYFCREQTTLPGQRTKQMRGNSALAEHTQVWSNLFLSSLKTKKRWRVRDFDWEGSIADVCQRSRSTSAGKNWLEVRRREGENAHLSPQWNMYLIYLTQEWWGDSGKSKVSFSGALLHSQLWSKSMSSLKGLSFSFSHNSWGEGEGKSQMSVRFWQETFSVNLR